MAHSGRSRGRLAAERLAEELTITAADGVTLAATLFAADPPRAVVVIASATGVRRTYYQRFASYLCEHGFTVISFDYRGIGGSRPDSLRGFQATVKDWGQLDLPAVLRHARQPDLPLYMVGHSVGGQLLGFLPEDAEPDAVYLVASQVADVRLWEGRARYSFGLAVGLLIPGSALLFGYMPGKVIGSEDLPRGVALEWSRWCRTRGYHLGAVPGVRERFASLRMPISVTSVDDDWYAPKAAVDALSRAICSSAVRRRHVFPADADVTEIGHFGFFRKGFHDTLWPDAVQWFEAV